MKPESAQPVVKLRPDAPVFVPADNNKSIVRTLFPQQHGGSPPAVSINGPSCVLTCCGAIIGKEEPQCSRYSRKYVRRVDDSPNSPRPILGTNNTTPRPILGRKDNGGMGSTSTPDDDSNDKENLDDEYVGKDFRSIYRRLQRLKIADDKRVKRKN